MPEFVAATNKAINEFQTLIAQVQKSSSMIEKVVHQVANTRVIPPPAAEGDIMDLQEFFEMVDGFRAARTEELVKAYRTISPLLGKIEEVVAGTNSGKSTQLASYYAHWERIIFSALNSMVVSALEAFQDMLQTRHRPLFKVRGSKRLCSCHCSFFRECPTTFCAIIALSSCCVYVHSETLVAERDLPCCLHPQVTLSLQNMDVCEQPPINDMNKQLARMMRSMVESTRQFVRWMDGTCMECPDQFPNGPDEEPVIFSYFMDIGSNPQVIKHMITLNQMVQKVRCCRGSPPNYTLHNTRSN